MSAPKISACVITFNEEEHIRACLESVKWADEIVVVDSFSTDRTVEIAREYTSRVVQRKWAGINDQRNFTLTQATGDWVFALDADERVSPELASQIRQAVQENADGAAGYTMPRRTWYLNRWITHGGWYPDRKLRLMRRAAARYEGTDPHDHVAVAGPVRELAGELHHYTYRDIADHVATINNFTTVAARQMRARGTRHALLHMLVNPPGRFLRMYLLRRGFLDGVPGLIVAGLSAWYVFLKYAKLWEMDRAETGD